MKKILLGVFIFLVGTTFAQDKRLSFSNGYVNSGKFKVTKSVTEGDSYIDVTYNFTGAYMYNQVENGKTYARIDMPDARVLDIKGEPAVPYYNDLLAITSEKNVSVSIVKSSYKEYSVSNTVLPSLGNFTEASKAPKLSESKLYSVNSLYPSAIAKIENVNSFKTVPFASVSVYPVRVNPVTNKVRCYSSITYRLSYKSADVSKSLKSSLNSLAPLREVISNPKTLDAFGESDSNLRATTSAYDYVIVTTPTYAEAAKKMSDWKTMCGYRCTTIVNTWAESDTTRIKSILRNIYASHIPDYLLIIGDHQDVPATYMTVKHDRTDSYKVVKFYSDNAYACANDRDYIEDVAKGRISVSSLSEANSIVNKIINYEKNPTTDASFYNKILSLAYFQDDKDDNTNTYDGKEDRWFVETAEYIKKDLESRSYTVDRFYTKDYADGVCPAKMNNGTSIPSELLNCSSNWNRDISNLINAVNNGRSIVYYRGHGSFSGLGSVGFNKDQAQNLRNSNKYPVFFNFTCLTGTFAEHAKTNPCFSEYLLRMNNAGAVGVSGNSAVGWSPTTESLAKGVFSSIYNDKISSVGDALTRGLLIMGSSSTYHEHMHKVTHYFGDPSMEIWTDVPTCFFPTITKEGSNIRVKTGGVSGCKVTICRISDMTILDTLTISGTEKLFNVGNAPCYVTITKHNYIPYVGVVRDLYLQNMSFTEDRTVHGVNVTVGKNVTSDLTQGNVYVKKGKTTLLATSSLKLKTGFIVKSGAKFVGKKQARPCNYSGNGPRSLRSADIDLEYDDEEFEIDPEITDIDDAVSDANGIEIYPNPTDGMLYIRSNNTINKVIVTDLTGKVILDEIGGSNEVEIDLSSNAQGMYLLNVVTDNDFYVEKVVLK